LENVPEISTTDETRAVGIDVQDRVYIYGTYWFFVVNVIRAN